MLLRVYKICTYQNALLAKEISKQLKNCTAVYAKYLSNSCQRNHWHLNKWNDKQQQQQYSWKYMSYKSSNNKENEDIGMTEKIYVGPLAKRMRAVKVFSLTTSLVGLAAQPMLLERGMELGGAPVAIFLCGFVGVFTFVTPFLLHIITKNYVTELHYNKEKDEYIATTVSIILKKIQTKFHPNDVKVPEVPGMFTSFIVHKKPLFIDPSIFENPDHYARIMGYDKPIDFKMDLKESNQMDLKVPTAQTHKNITEAK